MPSPHIVKVDKNWIDVVEKSNLDFFLSSYGSATDGAKGASNSKDVSSNAVHSVSLPPLRLRTPRGGELEIDSTFQKQLRVAKLCHVLGLPEVLTEWRFPKTQVPSRPDYSRCSMPLFRHTGKPSQKEVEPPRNTPSKYHVKNLQDIEELQELRSDNVPSYVAAYLESSPRDPLAAEESSRRAAAMLNNEAAPRKVYLPIVNSANMHDKPLQPTDVRQPVQAFHHWCFGCRLEHSVHTLDTHPTYDVYMCQNKHCRYVRWQDLPVLFGPFRDKPVRVGGGFAYMDRRYMEPDYMTPPNREELQDKEGNSFYRKHTGVPKPRELPKMYRPGFVPFKPKIQQRENFRSSRLPNIPESDGSLSGSLDFDPKVLLGDRNDVPLADLHHIHVDVQVGNRKRERLPSPNNTSAPNDKIDQNMDSIVDQLIAQTAAVSADPTVSPADSAESNEGHDVLDSDALSSTVQPLPPDAPECVEVQNSIRDNESAAAVIQPGSSELDTSDSVTGEELAGGQDELQNSTETSANVMKEGTVSTNEGSHSIPHNADLTASLQQSVVVTSYAQEATEPDLTTVSGIAESTHSNSSSIVVPSVGSPEPPHSPDLQPLLSSISTGDSKRRVARGFRSPYQHIVLNKIPAKPDNTPSADVVCTTPQLPASEQLTITDNSSDQQVDAIRSVKPPTEAVPKDIDGPSKPGSPESVPEPAPLETSLSTDEEEVVSTTPPVVEAPVVNSPLLGDKPEFRWVVKPLDVELYESPFVPAQVYESPAAQHVDCVVHTDDNLVEMESNHVSTTIIASKEYVPIWTITREILHDVMDEVLKRIAKKKAPVKKTKRETVKKPVQKIREVKQKSPSPPPKLPTPPPPKEPTPPPPKEPTPPPKVPTPPPKEPTPPPKPLTPPPRRAVVLPPLPQMGSFVAAAPKPAKAVQPKLQPRRFGASLVSHSNPSHSKKHCKPRSPSPSSTSVTPNGARFSVRTLDSKVDGMEQQGNDWTFRQRLNVPSIAETPKEPPIVETLPDIVEKPQTPLPEEQPQPEPQPVIRRRIRRLPKNFAKVVRTFRKKSGPTVTKKELKSITNPLDYLAKYCLIHPDRLPVYERIFKEVVARQSPRFQEVYCVLDKSSEERPLPIQQVDMPPAPHDTLTEQKKSRIRDLAAMRDGQDLIAMNTAEYQVSKITFTMEQLNNKYDELLDQYAELEKARQQRMAMLAKELFPHILDPDFDAKSKSRKQKKDGKAKKKKVPECPKSALVEAESKLSNATIVQRLTSTEKCQVEEDDEMYRMRLKLNRLETKVKSAEGRMEELEAERLEMQVWAQELYFKESAESFQEPEFRRQQSALFNKFNPDLDEQMNIEEVEEALRTINGHLLTDKELQFIYHILKIPGRKVLNLKTFGCVAALSEKVQQLHPVIRKLINKFDFQALDVKMEKCKELYQLLYEGNVDKPHGTIPIRSLCVELQAGGLTEEHLDFVTNKFNSAQKGYVEYMDFLTYVPLFVELHDRICSNPLTTARVS